MRISKTLKNLQLDIFVIGKVVRGNGQVFILKNDGNTEALENRGFTHLG